MKIKDKKALIGLLGLVGILVILIVSMVVPSASIFQGRLGPLEAANTCQSIQISSIPDSLGANEAAILIVNIEPENWIGSIRATASGGSFKDLSNKEGALIDTTDKVLSFSGSDTDTTITIQALGTGNEECIATLNVIDKDVIACQSLQVSTYPMTLLENESAEISIKASPETWKGTFLIRADSGKLQLTSADQGAIGQNTNLLVTSNNKVLYNGGKSGEKIEIIALGERNTDCTATLTIGSK